MTGTTSIKIQNATLDEDPEGRGIVVKGIVAPESLQHLQKDTYQREQLSDVKISELMDAHRTSRVPVVELGMRGDESKIVTRSDTYYLQAPTFIVDGYQRISAGILVMEVPPVATPRIDAIIHLNTNFEWERRRFDVLNLGQTRLSGNVSLRNLQWDGEAVKLLVKLSSSRSFILCDKISWDQNMKRGHLMSGVTFARTVGMLHSHIGPGRSVTGVAVGKGLEKIMANTGPRVFADNIKTFFDIIDKSWGVQNVAYRSSNNQLKLTFMLALARMLSDHLDFWNDARLVIDDATIKKLATFPLNDPAVSNLVSSGGGKSAEVLAIMLADHVNQYRKTRRIRRRSSADEVDFESYASEEED